MELLRIQALQADQQLKKVKDHIHRTQGKVMPQLNTSQQLERIMQPKTVAME